MAGVFTSPTQAFADFKPKPSILVPLIVTLVVAGLSAVLIARQAGMTQYEMLQTSTVLPPQALEQMRTDAENPSILKSGLGGGVAVVVIGVLAALLAWFLVSVVFGKSAKFKTVWGVELLGGLIPILGGLLRVPLVLAKDSMLVSYGLAALFPQKDFTSIFYSILFYFDAFAIWGIIVAGYGYATVFELSKGKGITIAAISTGILVFVMIALGAVGMSLAGVDISFF
jgi:hypothetical protein